MKKPFLQVTIKCKPLVKAYLENNFGKEINIPEEHVLGKLFLSLLVKNNSRPDGTCIEYESEATVNICVRSYIYDGVAMNRVNTRAFNAAAENYIRNFTRSNLDSLLMLQEQQREWKDTFRRSLLNRMAVVSAESQKELRTLIRSIEKELAAHELNIKTAIETVIMDTLKLDFTVLNYEAVKKDYYRYRQKKFLTLMSLNQNNHA